VISAGTPLLDKRFPPFHARNCQLFTKIFADTEKAVAVTEKGVPPWLTNFSEPTHTLRKIREALSIAISVTRWMSI
jgi:hypothetical protein